MDTACRILGVQGDKLKNKLATINLDHRPEGQSLEDYLMTEVVQYFNVSLVGVDLGEVRWFHATRLHPDETFQEGLLPVNLVMGKIGDLLESLFSSIEKRRKFKHFWNDLIHNTLPRPFNSSSGYNQFRWRMSNAGSDFGPHAFLIKERIVDDQNHRYFDAPEIIEDISQIWSSYEDGTDLLDLYQKKTLPCIVEFTMSTDRPAEFFLKPMLCYLSQIYFPAIFSFPSTDLNTCYNGNGVPVPTELIKLEWNPLKTL